MAYHEPSGGTGAVAMVVGENPSILDLDLGAHGYHSFEVMDTCRPVVGHEMGDADLSLLSYLDCLQSSYEDYERRVEGAHYVNTFDQLAFHTPFAGMVRGAHRKMMRQLVHANPDEIEKDFQQRVAPSLRYCVEVGNIYSATLYLALCGVVAEAKEKKSPQRVGLFSYGSGCSSEFFSGVLRNQPLTSFDATGLESALQKRYRLSLKEYDCLLDLNTQWGFGVRSSQVDQNGFREIYEKQVEGHGLLMLKHIDGYHRQYDWS